MLTFIMLLYNCYADFREEIKFIYKFTGDAFLNTCIGKIPRLKNKSK